MIKYIFCFIDKDEDGLFRDLTLEKNQHLIDFLPSHKLYNSKLITTIEKMALSYKLNMHIQVPFQSVFYNLDNYPYEPTNLYRIIMPTTSISKFSMKYLEAFKKKHPNVELYALLTDSMNAASPHLNLVRDKLFSTVWKAVLTYDAYDAKQYGFKYYGYLCYSLFDDVEPSKTTSDVYYVGFDKGDRARTVEEVYYYLSHNCNCKFDVVTKDQEKLTNAGELKYQVSKIPYREVVARTKAANCVLEILQNNQLTQSLRWFEAVAYNKKLLTNNKNIVNMPYYNPETMRYFESIDDIDVQWIKEKRMIDYGYHGEFSPVNLIRFIDNLNMKEEYQ